MTHHTCINTGTTTDGRPLPPCAACQAIPFDEFMRMRRQWTIEQTDPDYWVVCDRGLVVRFDVESDGRIIADIPALPGVMAYGATRDDALRKVKALTLRVLADRIENGEAE